MIQKKRNWERMESGGNDEKFLPTGLALTGIAVEEGYATATPQPKGEDGRWRNPQQAGPVGERNQALPSP